MSEPLEAFELEQLASGTFRPTVSTNAWVVAAADPSPRLDIAWDAEQTIREIVLHFDTDFDHAMETAQWGHPEDVMPFCVRDYVLRDADGKELHRCSGNHQTVNRIRFAEPVCTRGLSLELTHPSAQVPAALFGIRIY